MAIAERPAAATPATPTTPGTPASTTGTGAPAGLLPPLMRHSLTRTGRRSRRPGRIVAGSHVALHVGFGRADVTCDGVEVLDGEALAHRGIELQLGDIETMVRRQPTRDWRVSIETPFWSQEYQRQGRAWVLVSESEGFA